jgi:hypothetical protein
MYPPAAGVWISFLPGFIGPISLVVDRGSFNRGKYITFAHGKVSRRGCMVKLANTVILKCQEQCSIVTHCFEVALIVIEADKNR